ncbi:hypothetical protein TRIUR3_20787 [Triticum urartu]|uniref:Uncharacterized protein n=1 Tax=Triticum urartu TaxID=4572 RepID=M7YKD2_TRIUA|nr:hypothetical protein TRIUR3_20787 [Triticum urartu]
MEYQGAGQRALCSPRGCDLGEERVGRHMKDCEDQGFFFAGGKVETLLREHVAYILAAFLLSVLDTFQQ